MSRENIHERRAYIKKLLEQGQEIDIRKMIRMWDSSYPAIRVDIEICRGHRDPYYEKKDPVYMQNRRAARMGIEGKLSNEAWDEILEAHNNACAHCGATDDIAIDHIIPLSRGGKNSRENIQPLCRSCNSSKNNRTPKEWTAARRNGRKGGRPRKERSN